MKTRHMQGKQLPNHAGTPVTDSPGRSGPAPLSVGKTAETAAILEGFAAIVAEMAAERVLSLMPAQRSPYMSVSEAAEYARCRPQRIYDLTSAGRLRRYKDGSRTLVRRDELDDYLRRVA